MNHPHFEKLNRIDPNASVLLKRAEAHRQAGTRCPVHTVARLREIAAAAGVNPDEVHPAPQARRAPGPEATEEPGPR